MLREGSGEPLVLFHGILCSERVWRNVVPLLAEDFDVVALNALGHRGGPAAGDSRPATIEALTDAAERQLDELGIEQAHLAGNSLGGWMALELARRGRARSVCALSPAGFWDEVGGRTGAHLQGAAARRCATSAAAGASRRRSARSRALSPLGDARRLPPRRPGEPGGRSSTPATTRSAATSRRS